MKFIPVAILVALLVGCGTNDSGSTTPEMFEAANKACEPHGGLQRIRGDQRTMMGESRILRKFVTFVDCKDDTIFQRVYMKSEVK